MSADRFFWFDPFGEAPQGAVVTGTAGGSIWWGTGGSYPELRAHAVRSMAEQVWAGMEQSSFIRALRAAQEPPAGFQLGVGEPREPEEFARIEFSRHRYVVKDLPNG